MTQYHKDHRGLMPCGFGHEVEMDCDACKEVMAESDALDATDQRAKDQMHDSL